MDIAGTPTTCFLAIKVQHMCVRCKSILISIPNGTKIDDIYKKSC